MLAGLVALAVAALLSVGVQAGAPKNWAATWATGNKVALIPGFDDERPPPSTDDEVGTTLRQIVRISLGGEYFRVWLTNELGTSPLAVGAANLAVRSVDSAIEGSGQPLTFGGSTGVTIPAGERVASDPVYLPAQDLADLAISIFLPGPTSESSPITYHPRALQTNYQLDGVDATGAPDLPGAIENFVFAYLAAVDVATKGKVAVVATIGDSLTDGDGATLFPEPIDLNARYPNYLAELILERNSPGIGRRVGQIAAVANVGISGNQVTNTLIGLRGQDRLARDVLPLSGVTHVIIWEGINDIGLPYFLGVLGGNPTPAHTPAAAIIAGLQDMAEQARAAGLKVIGCTITPSGGYFFPGYNVAGSPTADPIRQEVNAWIRTSGAFDVVVDLDALVRDDDGDPRFIRGEPGELTIDGLHYTPAAYRMIAEEIFASLFRGNGNHLL